LIRKPLVSVIIIFIIAIGGYVGWLQYNYTPPTEKEIASKPSNSVSFSLKKDKVEKEETNEISKEEKIIKKKKEKKKKIEKGLSPNAPVEMASSPDPDLVIESDFGPLPIISEDGKEPWKVYARPYNIKNKRPKIAILLAGLGLSEGATNSAIQELPGSVTLSFTPYAPRLEEWIDLSRAAGHEVILELPMESYDYPSSDPGPHTLLTTLDAEKNIERLNFLLSRFTGYVGVTNFLGDKFSDDSTSFKPILEEIRKRGLLLLESKINNNNNTSFIATEIDLPHAKNNHFLDIKASRVAIDSKLFELEKIAEKNGLAVGIGFSYPVTMERIAKWSVTLSDKGIDLVPVSSIASIKLATKKSKINE
ncbi:MAG: hypothetical protein CFH01_01913, partial [Alphaproteobacteria bacterium MarineAlpha2_Bin1]